MSDHRVSLADVLLEIADECDAKPQTSKRAKEFSFQYLRGLGYSEDDIASFLLGRPCTQG